MKIGHMLEHPSFEPLPGQTVLNHLHHQSTAMLLGALTEFVRAEPMGAHNALIESAQGLMGHHAAGKGKTQVGDISGACLVNKARQINADAMQNTHVVAGFLERLAAYSL
jgi:hypothetical protein